MNYSNGLSSIKRYFTVQFSKLELFLQHIELNPNEVKTQSLIFSGKSVRYSLFMNFIFTWRPPCKRIAYVIFSETIQFNRDECIRRIPSSSKKRSQFSEMQTKAQFLLSTFPLKTFEFEWMNLFLVFCSGWCATTLLCWFCEYIECVSFEMISSNNDLSHDYSRAQIIFS